MIHLFCNETYGARFLEVAARWSRTRGEALVCWRSTRGLPANSAWRKRVRARWKRWRDSIRCRCRVAGVRDVNDSGFLDSIPRGSHGVVAGFDQIFKPDSIERFATLVNYHPSLLPFYRGPVPSHWCLENGESRTGFTLHRITARVDEGERLAQGVIDIVAGASARDVDRAIANAASATLEAWLEHACFGASFQPTLVDAARVYRVRAGYMSFPTHPSSEPTR